VPVVVLVVAVVEPNRTVQQIALEVLVEQVPAVRETPAVKEETELSTR
jgi:hypothetical protein